MTIFLDVDGVVADFDGHYQRHFGVRPTRWPEPDNVDWRLVNSVPDFYRTIPLMPRARELFQRVVDCGEGCAFLTGIPVSIDAASNQKKEWIAEHFPNVECICCRARDKWEHGRPGDTLIDDYVKYKSAWTSMGGFFIHHTSVPETIKELWKAGVHPPGLPFTEWTRRYMTVN